MGNAKAILLNLSVDCSAVAEVRIYKAVQKGELYVQWLYLYRGNSQPQLENVKPMPGSTDTLSAQTPSHRLPLVLFTCTGMHIATTSYYSQRAHLRSHLYARTPTIRYIMLSSCTIRHVERRCAAGHPAECKQRDTQQLRMLGDTPLQTPLKTQFRTPFRALIRTPFDTPCQLAPKPTACSLLRQLESNRSAARCCPPCN